MASAVALPPWMKAVERLIQSAIPNVIDAAKATETQEAHPLISDSSSSDTYDDRSLAVSRNTARGIAGISAEEAAFFSEIDYETSIPSEWHFDAVLADEAG